MTSGRQTQPIPSFPASQLIPALIPSFPARTPRPTAPSRIASLSPA